MAARYIVSRPAEADISSLPITSREHWGAESRSNYAALVTAALRQAAADPYGRLSRDRDDLVPGLRSIHLRHIRQDSRLGKVAHPVHVLFYRSIETGLIEIMRVLHERMEPGLHLRNNI